MSGSNNASVVLANGTELDVRQFTVEEGMSQLFEISVTAVSTDATLDLGGMVGKGAALKIISASGAGSRVRVWSGICAFAQQASSDDAGLSAYRLTIVPSLARAALRTNNRIFQHKSVPDIVQAILSEWQIEPELKLEDTYPPLEYRVQYHETDFAFIARLLEEAGISFFFSQAAEEGQGASVTKLVLADAPQTAAKRPGPLPYLGSGSFGANAPGDHASNATLGQRMGVGRVVVRDFDFRLRPDTPLFSRATGDADNQPYETYLFAHHAAWVEGGAGGGTPAADDQGTARTSADHAKSIAERLLDSDRARAKTVSFATSAFDVAPGTVLSLGDGSAQLHPHPALDPSTSLLVTQTYLSGESQSEWSLRATAVMASATYRPAERTPKPRIVGVHSALVVGPAGKEIYTDEFGRVRVQFHWDRDGKYAETSSCWLRVARGWSGGGFGLFHVPRVGHEVVVAFFDGDPDRPIIVGEVHNQINGTPYKLPDHATRSGWRSQSSPGGIGFNEIMFEDATGSELVSVQAERDLKTVVKNNEERHVVANQSIYVGKNELHDVGEVFRVSVGPGVSIGAAKDKTIVVTTGAATVVLSDDSISLDAKGDVHIRAGGQITMSAAGGPVQIDGGPQVLLNCASTPAAQPTTAKDAVVPYQGLVADGPPYRAAGSVTVDKPTPMQDVTI